VLFFFFFVDVIVLMVQIGGDQVIKSVHFQRERERSRRLFERVRAEEEEEEKEEEVVEEWVVI
jgi:uncharacterized membrane protein